MTTPDTELATPAAGAADEESASPGAPESVSQHLLTMIARGSAMALPGSPAGSGAATEILQAIQSIAGNQSVQRWVQGVLGTGVASGVTGGGAGAGAGASVGAGASAGGTQWDAPAGPSAVDQLRTGSTAGWFGTIDDKAMLELIRFMGPEERAAVAADEIIMNNLAGAFNADEMIELLFMLQVELKWRGHWLQQASVLADIPAQQWMTWFGNAPENQIAEFFGWVDMARAVVATIAVPPASLLLVQALQGSYGRLVATLPALAQWIIDRSPDPGTWLDAIASVWISDADLPLVVARMRTQGAWPTFLMLIPRGVASPTNRASLRRLAGVLPMPDCAMLFAIRFNTAMQNSATVSWIAEDVRAVWDPLALLPDEDVTENMALQMFTAISGDAATWSSGTGSVNLGQGLRTSTFHPEDASLEGTPNPARIQDTVRHEVGHAVHTQNASTIDSWLQSEVGFWYYAGGDPGVRAVITDLGGFPAQWHDKSNTAVAFASAEQERIVALLVANSGNESWTSATTLPDTSIIARDPTFATDSDSPAEHDAMLWEAMPQAVRDCWELSKDRWYHNYASFPIGAQGRTFWNHWYSKGYHFSATAKTAIDVIHDDYTAMSEKEFFANCYSEFFRNPAGYNDHTLWGGALDPSIQAFMRAHVLERQPYTPPTPAAGAVTPPPPGTPPPPPPTGAGGVPRPD